MKIGVVGLGLIGGSICKSVCKNTPHRCYGMDLSEAVMAKALADGAIHDTLSESCLSEMDITIVCLHPLQTIDFIINNAQNFSKGSIVTDVCGIKEAVVEGVDTLLAQNGVFFVGAHPMAGREFSGYDYSLDTLFDGASFILTPLEQTDKNAVEILRSLALEMGFCRVVVSTPCEHDRIIAFTSQLAHIVSSAYVKSPQLLRQQGFSAGSFQDLTRVAKLDENMWTDLFMLNKDALGTEIDTIIANLEKYRDAIQTGDSTRLRMLLREGRMLKEKSLDESVPK